MTVPKSQAFSTVPEAGVFTYTGSDWNIKVNATTLVNLGNGGINTNVGSSDMVVYFPTATLAFG